MNNDETQISKCVSSLVFADHYHEAHEPFIAILRNEIFSPRSGQNMEQAGRLAYERSAWIGTHYASPVDISNDIWKLCALAEWPGLIDVSTFSILMVHYNLTVGTIVDNSTNSSSQRALLDKLNSMDHFGPYMATELGYGNNVAGLETTATYDDAREAFFLNSPSVRSLKFMSYSGFADIPKTAVVLARTHIHGNDIGVTPFLVPLVSDEGDLKDGIAVLPTPEKPTQGLDNGLTRFVNVEVPATNWLSRQIGQIEEDAFIPRTRSVQTRFHQSMSRIIPGRLCVASSALGAARAGLFIAIQYAQRRKVNAPGTKHKPIFDYAMYKRSTIPHLTTVLVYSHFLNKVKASYALSPDSNDVARNASLVKAVSTKYVTRVLTECRERMGAQGLFSVNRVNDLISLVQGQTTAEGDSDVLLTTVGRQILTSGLELPGEVVHHPVTAFMGLNTIARALKSVCSCDRDDILRAKNRASSGKAFDRISATQLYVNRYGTSAHNEKAFLLFAAQVEAERTPAAKRALAHVAIVYGLSYLKERGCDDIPELRGMDLDTQIDKSVSELSRDINAILDGFNLATVLEGIPAYGSDPEASFVEACAMLAEDPNNFAKGIK